jgi:ankyrin repeat protein
MDFDEEDDPASDILYAGTPYQTSCFDLLARTGDAEWLLELLAAHKPLVTTADPNGNTPLHFAAANGNDGTK